MSQLLALTCANIQCSAFRFLLLMLTVQDTAVDRCWWSLFRLHYCWRRYCPGAGGAAANLWPPPPPYSRYVSWMCAADILRLGETGVARRRRPVSASSASITTHHIRNSYNVHACGDYQCNAVSPYSSWCQVRLAKLHVWVQV